MEALLRSSRLLPARTRKREASDVQAIAGPSGSPAADDDRGEQHERSGEPDVRRVHASALLPRRVHDRVEVSRCAVQRSSMCPKRQIATAIAQVATNMPTITKPRKLMLMFSNQYQNEPER